jgi:hypothetical protein
MFTLDNTTRIRSIRRIRQPHRSQEQQRAPKPSPTTRIHTQNQFPVDYDRRKLPIPRRRFCPISGLQFFATTSLANPSVSDKFGGSGNRGSEGSFGHRPRHAAPRNVALAGNFRLGSRVWKSYRSICEERVVEEWAPSVGKKVLRGAHVSDTCLPRGTSWEWRGLVGCPPRLTNTIGDPN